MTSPSVTKSRCARCGRALVKNHDQVECLACGTVEVPTLTLEEAKAETSLQDGRIRLRGPSHLAGPEWTATERLTWKTWKEGDPVPDENGNEQEFKNGDPALQTLDTAKLAVLMVQSLRKLALELGPLQAKETLMRAEAKKLLGILALCDGEVPAEVASVFGASSKTKSKEPRAALGADGYVSCGECGRSFMGLQALGTHKARKHGPGWSTAANFTKAAAAVGE